MAAGAQRVGLAEELEQVAGVHHRAVGTEVAGAVLDEPAGQEDPRIGLGRHADPGIGLRILQEDVVPGLVLLDQVILEQQGVGLGIDDGILCVGDFGHQQAGLRIQPLRRHEILRDPLVEAFIN